MNQDEIKAEVDDLLDNIQWIAARSCLVGVMLGFLAGTVAVAVIVMVLSVR